MKFFCQLLARVRPPFSASCLSLSPSSPSSPMDTLFDDTLLAPAAESTPEAATAYEELACCNVCGEGDWEEDNKIIFCDSCDLAVHQVGGTVARRESRGSSYTSAHSAR